MSTSAARRQASLMAFDRSSAVDATTGDEQPFSARQKETAQYIADMILELRNLAKSARLFQIMVPLEYAYYEAFGVANRVVVPAGEAERIRELSQACDESGLPEDD